MEKENKLSKIRFDLISAFLVVVGIGCSFIGPFYRIRHYEGDNKIDEAIRLWELVFKNPVGIPVQVFYLFVYLIIPAIAVILLLLVQYKKKLNMVAFMLLLTDAVVSIVIKDGFAEASSMGAIEYTVKEVYFCGLLPTIVFFVSAPLCLIAEQANNVFSVRDITEIGILVAMALILNFIPVYRMSTGGSINLQMIPLLLLALRRGPVKGFVGAGIVYGLISCLTDGYGMATYPFDYLVGFGSVAVLGLFQPMIFGKDQDGYNIRGEIFIFVGCVLSTLVRFVGSTVSSMVIYGYQIVPAMAYNAVYIPVSGAIGMVVLMALYGPLAKLNKRFPVEEHAFEEIETKEAE